MLANRWAWFHVEHDGTIHNLLISLLYLVQQSKTGNALKLLMHDDVGKVYQPH